MNEVWKIATDPLFVGFWALAVFGITGSLHCTAMCGPLASAACAARKNKTAGSNLFLYAVARGATYGIIGVVAGGISSITLDAITLTQKFHAQYLGVLSGVTILIFAIYDLLKMRGYFGAAHRAPPRFILFLQRTLPLPTPIILGMTTALLPCGFLYAAIVQSSLLADPIFSGVAMVLFSLVTMPALVMGVSVSEILKKLFPRHKDVLISFVLILVSVTMIGRSLLHAHGEESCPLHQDSSHD